MKIWIATITAAICSIAAFAGEPSKSSPKIEPKADQYLKAMARHLGGLKTFTFQVEEFFDVVQDDGQKLN